MESNDTEIMSAASGDEAAVKTEELAAADPAPAPLPAPRPADDRYRWAEEMLAQFPQSPEVTNVRANIRAGKYDARPQDLHDDLSDVARRAELSSRIED